MVFLAFTRKVRFEYFTVTYRRSEDPPEMVDRPFDLQRWFQRAETMTLMERTLKYYQDQVRLDKFYFSNDYGQWFLHFVRLRDTDLPSLASNDKEVWPIHLYDDEYIGEDVSGLYSHELGVLMLQRNYHSLGVTAVARYMNEIWGNSGEQIYLRPMLQLDVVERAMKAGSYRRLTVRFADVSAATFPKDDVSPLRTIIKEFGQYDGVSAEITVSLGRRKGTLRQEPVKASIRDVIANKKNVSKATLSIKSDNEPVEVLDLFDDQVYDEAFFSLEKRRSLTHNDVAYRMYELYEEKRPLLTGMLLPHARDKWDGRH